MPCSRQGGGCGALQGQTPFAFRVGPAPGDEEGDSGNRDLQTLFHHKKCNHLSLKCIFTLKWCSCASQLIHYMCVCVCMRGAQKQNLFFKNCVFLHIETSVTFKVLSIWCNTPIETFFHCSKQFWNSSILIPLSVSAIFLFHLFRIGKKFPFVDFFPAGKAKKFD